MTSLVDIAKHPSLAELLVHIDAGEEVLLMQDGAVVAVVRPVGNKAEQGGRVPGLLSHLGPMDDPYIFSRPDPELTELAEAHDEDDFYRPLPPKE